MSFTGWLQQQFRKANPSGTGHRAKPGPSSWLGLELLESRVVPTLLGNPLFPADNPWNQRITDAPVAANSDTLVQSIGLTKSVHADFGSAIWDGSLIGIPLNAVPGTQPKVNVVIDAYPGESDLQPIPIPAGALIE